MLSGLAQGEGHEDLRLGHGTVGERAWALHVKDLGLISSSGKALQAEVTQMLLHRFVPGFVLLLLPVHAASHRLENTSLL